MKPALRNFVGRHLAPTVWSLRILIGLVFVVSGLAKSIDIFGFVFKIEEYLEVVGFDIPRSIIMVCCMIVAGAEFTVGLMLMLGAYRRSAVWLLLAMMAVMLPLTLWVWITDPVSDCGCFGDFIHLSNAVTFWKNVLITGALIVLLPFNSKVKGAYHAYTQWLVASLASVFILVVALYGINVQPLVDFRSFAPGTTILSDEDEDEVTEFEYVYSKGGKEETFSIDNLPDSTWTFVSRHAINGDFGLNDHTELNVYDADGENVTDEAIATEGEQLIVVIPQQQRANLSGTYAINEFQRYMADKEGSIIELISTDRQGLEEWRDHSMASLPIYLADETTLKELSRGDISMVYVRDGIIQWKRTLPTVDVDLITSGRATLDDYDTDGPLILGTLLGILVASLTAVYLIDASRKFIEWRQKKKKQTLDANKA